MLVLAAAAVFLVLSAFVLVDETEYVIVQRLGQIAAVYDRPQDRGLHMKLPWPIDSVRRFDRRVQLFDPPGREIFTSDKKNLTVNTYVCWKIAEPGDRDLPSADRPVVRFFRGLGSLDVAEARLDTRVRSVLSTEIGRVELASLLNVTDSEKGPLDRPAGGDRGPGMIETISRELRGQVEKRPDEKESLRDRLGIEIVDVRIKRFNLPSGNQQAVFERMKSERQKIADRYRSAGLAEKKMIESQADRQYSEILARAAADAERIRGQAEAESISILNRAHAQDPEFYRTLRTLETYRKILNDKTTLVLSSSSNLLKLLTDGVPEMQSPPPAADKPAPTDSNNQPPADVSAVPRDATQLDGAAAGDPTVTQPAADPPAGAAQ